MLKLRNITLAVNKSTPLERSILRDVNLTLEPGECVALLGDNGAGKSTLFNLISGYTLPDSGTIILNNRDITRLSQQQRSVHVAKVLQDPRIGTLEHMTIEENLAFASLRGQYRGFSLCKSMARTQRFRELLALLGMGLEDRLDALVGTLSGGQRQALSLIMALSAPADILLLDEITAALDERAAERVMEITSMLVREQHQTVLMITHDRREAERYADRVVYLSGGVISIPT